MKQIKIGEKVIGEKTYIIAEFGVNHNGSVERAKEGIRKAAAAGADAIKFQTYTADELVVQGTPKFWEWEGDQQYINQYEAYKAIGGFPYPYYPEIIKCCEENNIEFLSTPFSFEAADYLNSLGMKAFKVASSDMSTLPFLEHIAKFNKPILLSTGASTMEEIREAVDTILDAGNDQIILLHCNLKYPTEEKDANLNIIQTLQREFPDLPIGISDHTLGKFPSMIAVAMGACVVEKHYTVDKTLPNSADHWLSLNPEQLQQVVEHVRRIELMRGETTRVVFPSEEETRKWDKRSIVTKVEIPEGTVITKEMLTYKRPGTGIWPKFVPLVVGKKAKENLAADTILQWTHV